MQQCDSFLSLPNAFNNYLRGGTSCTIVLMLEAMYLFTSDLAVNNYCMAG